MAENAKMELVIELDTRSGDAQVKQFNRIMASHIAGASALPGIFLENRTVTPASG